MFFLSLSGVIENVLNKLLRYWQHILRSSVVGNMLVATGYVRLAKNICSKLAQSKYLQLIIGYN